MKRISGLVMLPIVLSRLHIIADLSAGEHHDLMKTEVLSLEMDFASNLHSE